MSARSILLKALVLLIFLSISFIAVWQAFDLNERIRLLVLDYLRPHLGASLQIEKIFIGPTSVAVSTVDLDVSPQVVLNVKTINIHYSPLKFLLSKGQVSAAIQQIEFIKPQINLLEPQADNAKSSPEWHYKPFAVKTLKNLSFIKKMDVYNGSVAVGREEKIFARGIAGRLEIDRTSRILMKGSGLLPHLPGAGLSINGMADLNTGNFLLETVANASNISTWQVFREIDGVDSVKGEVQVRVEVRGGKDLRIIGGLQVKNLAFRYGELLKVAHGDLDGTLFGTSFRLNGSVNVNGLDLPLKGEISDITQAAWQMEITEPQINLAQLTLKGLGVKQIKGFLDLDLAVNGQGTQWNGFVRAGSKFIETAGLKARNVTVNADLINNNLQINGIDLNIADCDVNVKGTVDLTGQNHYLEWTVESEITDQKLLSHTGFDRLLFFMGGEVECDGDKWSGKGKGSLLNPDVSDQILLHSNIDLNDKKISTVISTGKRQGKIEIDVDLSSDPPDFQCAAENPQHILSKLLPAAEYPQLLDQYQINIFLEGNTTVLGSSPASLQFRSSFNSLRESRSARYKGIIRRIKPERYTLESSINMKFPDRTGIAGNCDLDFSDGSLSITQIRLDRVLAKEELTRVLLAKGQLNHVQTANTAKGKSVPDSLELVLENFPILELLRYLNPVLLKGIECDAGAWVFADKDSVSYSLLGEIKGEKISPYSLAAAGSVTAGKIKLDEAALLKEGAEKVFRMAGSVNMGDKEIDSLILSFNEFSVDDLTAVINLEKMPELDGLIDGRVVVSGDLHRPQLTLDAHLRSGMIREETGYWANLRIATADSLYQLARFDFGKDLAALISAQGSYHRWNNDLLLDFAGENVNLQNLTYAFSGTEVPVRGSSTFNIHLSGNYINPTVESVITIQPGMLGPLSFDNLRADLSLCGDQQNKYCLNIDSVAIDWGDSRGWASGVIPLTSGAELSVIGGASGRFTGWLNRLEKSLTRPQGHGSVDFELGGTLAHPKLKKAKFVLNGAGIEMEDVVRGISDFDADIEVDSSGRVEILNLEGEVEGRSFRIGNRFPALSEGEESIVIGDYDLGILQIETDNEGLWIVIPSFMRDEWGGNTVLKGRNGNGPFEFRGPAARPLGVGTVYLRNATFTYPFLKGSGRPPSPFVRGVLNLLNRMRWDARLYPEWGCRYVNEISGLGVLPFIESIQKEISSDFIDLDVKIYIDLLLDDDLKSLEFSGSLIDTLRIDGELTSTRGSIEYLDMKFQAQKLGVIFNPAELNPLLYGTAVTTVLDTSNIPRDIRLVIYNSLSGAGEEGELYYDPLNTAYGSNSGRWDEISVRFEDDQGHSQEQILAMMGYSPDQLSEKLYGLGGALVENAVPLRRWTRILERSLERWLGIDRLDIEPQVARNLIEGQLYPSADSTAVGIAHSKYLMALDQSRVTVGKYITRDLYLSYTGLLQSGADSYNVTRIGMVHNWDLILRLGRIAPNLNFNYRYQYDSLAELDDHSFSIKYSFFIDF